MKSENFRDIRARMHQNGHRDGFTLIELMIVVIIIAALAGMVIPRLVPRSDDVKAKLAFADIRTIESQLKLFYLDNGFYPKSLDALLANPGDAPRWKGPYLENDPVDPWGRRYVYKLPGTHKPAGFDLFSKGKDGQAGNDDDVSNWQPLL